MERFKTKLRQQIVAVLEKDPPDDDSPVYTFLQRLRRLKLPEDLEAHGAAVSAEFAAEDASPPDKTHSALIDEFVEAKSRGDFETAKTLLATVRKRMRGKNPDKPEDPYIIQQLALVTYKSEQPTPLAALEEARDLLRTLNPETSNDTETLGRWGAVHKHLWDETGDGAHLDEAVCAYERAFRLRNDHYNGINLAFLLNARAASSCRRAESADEPEEVTRLRADAVAYFVHAGKVRGEVLKICGVALRDERLSDYEKYWLLATMAEAYLGTGDEERANRKLQEALAVPHAAWMQESTEEQLNNLRELLAYSPLKFVRTDGA